jgi:ABC-2 type transport system permease protein
MNAVPLYASATAGVLKRDFLMYISYRTRFFSQVTAIFVSLALFYYISRLVRVEGFTPDSYFAYVVAGIAVIELLTATIQTIPLTLRGELVAGTFERMAVSPLGPVAGIVAMAAFPICLSFVTATATILVSVLIFGMDVQWSTAPLVYPTMLLGSLALLPLALMVAAVVVVSKVAGGLGGLVVTGLSLAGGAFFPVSVLPSWIQWISDVQPFTPALQLLRHQLLGAPIEGSGWLAAGKLAGFAVVLIPLAIVALRTSVQICRRRGTLTEY